MTIIKTRTDDAIADRFELALASHPGVPFGRIAFRVEAGTVVLMGSTTTLDERAAIYEVIEDFAVLEHVDDRLNPANELKLAA